MSEENITVPQKKSKIIKFLWFVFGFSILVFIADFVYVIGIRKELFNETPLVFGLILLLIIPIGAIAFFLAVILGLLKKHSGKNKITFS